MLTVDFVVVQRERYDSFAALLESLNRQSEIFYRLIIMHCKGDLKQEEQAISRCAPRMDCTLVHSEVHYENVLGANNGRKFVASPYMGIMDADCIYPDGFMKRVKDILEANLNKKIIIGARRREGGGGGTYYDPGPLNDHMCGSFMLFRTEDFDAVGGFNPFLYSLGGWMDTIFIKKMMELGCQKIDVGDLYIHPWHPKPEVSSGYGIPELIDRNLAIIDLSSFDPARMEWRYGDLYYQFNRPTTDPLAQVRKFPKKI